ncbi:hypothetical protein DUNSADRAFT_7801 [Dunaliella salina]|uniref:Uncharacterized protein n=1 Tax=Dunaliella salina TaxID=3046 RepID=A0ABQ7GKN9_DUNSA|nr:hypothetical protein DUNSADRAFT_7801 [Dunaliella salina]|eukprot:KAF5835173.1 hypothetical protein DUNSADRAFT_7801 [Dunaliella salina]
MIGSNFLSDSGGEEEEEVQIQPDADRVDFLKKHTVRANKDELLKQAGTIFAPRGRSTRQSKRLKQQAPSVLALLPETSCPPPQPQPQQQQKPSAGAVLPPLPCGELEPLPAPPAVLAQEAQEIQHLLELVMEPHPSGAHAAEPAAQDSPQHLQHPLGSKTRQNAWEDPKLLQRQRQLQPSLDAQAWLLGGAPLPATRGDQAWQGGGTEEDRKRAAGGPVRQGVLPGQTHMPPSSTVRHHSTPSASPAPAQQQRQQQRQQQHQHPLQQILGGGGNSVAVGSHAAVHAFSGSEPALASDSSPPWMAYVHQKGHGKGSTRLPHQQSPGSTTTGNAAAAAAARSAQPTPARPSSPQQALGTHPGCVSQGLPRAREARGVGLHVGVRGASQGGAGRGAELGKCGGIGPGTNRVYQGADAGLQSSSQGHCREDPGLSQLLGGGARVGGASAAVRARDRKAAKLQKGSVLYQGAETAGPGGTQKEGKGGGPKAGSAASTKGGAAAILGDGPCSQEQQQQQKRGRVAELYTQTPSHQQRQRHQAEIVVPAGASPLDVLLPASKPCRSPTQAPWASTPLQPAAPQQAAHNNAGPSAAPKGGGALAALGVGASTPTPAPPPSTTKRKGGNQSLVAILLASSDEDEQGHTNRMPTEHQLDMNRTPQQQPYPSSIRGGTPTAHTFGPTQAQLQHPPPFHTIHPSTPAVNPTMSTHTNNYHTASTKTTAQAPTTPIPCYTTPTPATTSATPGAATTPPPSYSIPAFSAQYWPTSHARPPRAPNAMHASANAGVVAGGAVGMSAGGGGEGAGVLQVMEAQRAQQRAVLSILPPAEPSPISRLVGSAGSLGSCSRAVGGGSSSDAIQQGPSSQGMSGRLCGGDIQPSAGVGGTAGGMGGGIAGVTVGGATGGLGGIGMRGGRGGAKSRGLTGRLKQLQGVVGARQRELLEEWRHGDQGAGGVATQRPAASQPPKPSLCMTVLSSSLEAHVAKCVCACEGMAGGCSK